MKIRMLIENTAAQGDLVAEHGLSLFIETEKHKILFDAGQSGAFADNAARMGVDLAQADMAILSHGHYDHGGGLFRFLEVNDHAPVYMHKFAFDAHYNGFVRYIGLDEKLKTSGRIIYTDDLHVLDESMTLCTCNSSKRDYPSSGDGLYLQTTDGFVPDIFEDEQYLILEEKGKRIVISGCSHKGILNISQWLKPDVLVGGFHFKGMDPEGEHREFLTRAAKQLKDSGAVYYTCHCTGEAAFGFMKSLMDRQLFYLSGGAEIEI